MDTFLMDLSRPQIMGILNVTTDSFYARSRTISEKELLLAAEKHVVEGASILDIGGMSTRPNSVMVSEEDERTRIVEALTLLKKEFPTILISVDTFRSSVAQSAIDFGASIINDISGFQFDPALFDVIVRNKISYILMHVHGTFETMHQVVEEGDVVNRVKNYFQDKLSLLESSGLKNVVLDPGFGFSKTLEDNYELLHNMEQLSQFNKPILVGISRKSMIYKKLNVTPEESLNGTTALNTIALLKGANILRVHDVKACKQVIDLLFS